MGVAEGCHNLLLVATVWPVLLAEVFLPLFVRRAPMTSR
jgi:hypothetical protein